MTVSESVAHPSRYEIDLGAIAHNVRALKAHVGGGVALAAVVKGNAYGHGALEVARAALAHGGDLLAVAYLSEAIALREAGIAAPMLVLAHTPAALAPEALRHDVAVSISDSTVALALSQAAIRAGGGRQARAHIKIDTGMGRLGVLPREAAAFIQATQALPGVNVEGVFTHFSCADSDPAYTHLQLGRFRGIIEALGPARSSIRWIHAANSAAVLAYPEAHFNLVRPGIALYGLTPFESGWGRLRGALRPALAWKASVALVKTLPAGTPVSYGNTYICPSERRIAVIPVGYADGFRRAPQNPGYMLVRGRRAPIVGRVCMDQTMIDVSDIDDVRIGDEAVLIGRQNEESITAEMFAEQIGSINYEVTTALLARAPRVYTHLDI